MIGNTPIIKLQKIVPENAAEVWLKYEAVNPTGSYKDRMAKSVLVNALKRGERVELRDIFTIEPRIQKARISRNPKTNEKVNTPEKKAILMKISKEWSKKINEKV